MLYLDVLHAWGRILQGRAPSMSLEITRECPLHCPGCYAYEDQHVGGGVTLRQLIDHWGDDLVQAVLRVVDRERPLHLSIVGGDPLVRCRELDVLLPQLVQRRIFVQVVTSAFRPIPISWTTLPRFNLVVSIDGLQKEHDKRRSATTYARIPRNIAGHRVIVHCTVTAQMMKTPGYLREFLRFWSPRPEIKKVWMSLFTPQRGANSPECLSACERARAIEDLLFLRRTYRKLDIAEGAIRQFASPPRSPDECIFARTMASMALAAIADHKIAGFLPIRHLFTSSARIGKILDGLRRISAPQRAA